MSGIAVVTLAVVLLADSSIDTGTGTGLGSDCSLGKTHTMCMYSGPRSGCTPGQLTDDQRNKIIKLHNEYRTKVASGSETRSSKPGINQPKAADMLRMKYDEELARVAQRWAEQCTFNHDENRKDKRFQSVGQNVAMSWSSDSAFAFSLETGVDGWYNEVQKYDPDAVESMVFSTDTGHYTQVVWHNTYLVGCGYAYTPEQKGVKYIFICNYAPGGNIKGSKLYTKGDACSKCPDDHLTCSDSLCG